jgi:ferredoxin
MRISIDRERCTVSALCTGLAPGVFALGNDGELVLITDSPTGEDAAEARFAIANCPRQALSTTEN